MKTTPVRVVADEQQTAKMVAQLVEEPADPEVAKKRALFTLVTRFNFQEAAAKALLGLT